MATATSSTSPLEIRLLKRFVRRWPIALAGLLATVVVCLAALRLVGPTYSAKASILLTPPTPPKATATTGNPNPYLNLGGLQPLADVVSRAMMSSTSLAALREAGLTGSYTVARDTTTDGPVLNVTAEADSGAAALHELGLVLGTANPQLNRLQAAESVAKKNRVTARVVAPDTTASLSRKSQIRALVVAIVAGLVGTALAVSTVDLLVVRRRDPERVRRRAASRTAPARAGARTASVAARPAWRPRILVRPGNGHNGKPRTADAGEGSPVPGTAEPRRRPRPGPEPLEEPSVMARVRRRGRANAPPSEPASEIEPEQEPDDRVGSHSP